MNDNQLEFQKVYDTFQPKIHRYLVRFVGDYEAEDLTQEVFVKVGQGLKEFRGESQLSTWIYKIATNSALDRLRSPSFHWTLGVSPFSEADLEIEDKDILTGGANLPLSRSRFVRK